MTDQEIKNELTEVVKFNSVTGEKVARIYKLNKLIFNDNQNHCTKCPSAIRNVFNKLKKHYKENYENR